jgi:hypothetical protein
MAEFREAPVQGAAIDIAQIYGIFVEKNTEHGITLLAVTEER